MFLGANHIYLVLKLHSALLEGKPEAVCPFRSQLQQVALTTKLDSWIVEEPLQTSFSIISLKVSSANMQDIFRVIISIFDPNVVLPCPESRVKLINRSVEK